MDTLASVANMSRYAHVRGIIAYSSVTREEYSATPGDYWIHPPHHILTDSEGNDMVLVVRQCQMIDVSEV